MRIVLVNFDGGSITLRCVEALVNLSYPRDRYEIVMVDNASIDGVVWSVRAKYPQVRIVESLVNEGFARGNNLAFGDLDLVDVVALINNDAVVEPDWLVELVRPLIEDPAIGITTSKMFFNRSVLGVALTSSSADLCVYEVRLGGLDVSRDVVFDERWTKSETNLCVGSTPRTSQCHRVRGVGSFSVEVSMESIPQTLEVCLSADSACKVRATGLDFDEEFYVESEPQWLRFKMQSLGKVINNAGGGIFRGFHGGDLGFKEFDLGQFELEADVFSFCGGAAALRSGIVRDLGGFDPSFFLYYEDLDLSWRAHFGGWRIRYVPTAVVHHEHAFSSGEWSPFFRFWVDRNRRLTLVKNAPLPVALRAILGAVVWGIRDSISPIAKSVIRLRKPEFRSASYRLRQLGSFLKALPAAYSFRRRQLSLTNVDPSFVYQWISTRHSPVVYKSSDLRH